MELFNCSRGVHVFNRNDEDEESEEDEYVDDQEEFLMPAQIPPGQPWLLSMSVVIVIANLCTRCTF